jgi:septum formation topological specificity factor MinE
MRFNYRSKPKERWQIIITNRRKETDPGIWVNMYGETGSIILQPGRCR